MAEVRQWAPLEHADMNIRPKKPLFTVSANVGSAILLFVPLGPLYEFYRLPAIALAIASCVVVYFLFKVERYNLLYLILPSIIACILVLEIFMQFYMFGPRSGYLYW